jgi:hypothetical protein
MHSHQSLHLFDIALRVCRRALDDLQNGRRLWLRDYRGLWALDYLLAHVDLSI